MKKILLCSLLAFCAHFAFAQFVYKIKADSVMITRDSCTAELIIENSTKNINGFLYNKGNGRTEFRKAVRLNDSTLVLGGDTIVVKGSADWSLTGNAGINPANNFLGTKDNQPLILRTNDTERFRVTPTGTLQVGIPHHRNTFLSSYHHQENITASNHASSYGIEQALFRHISYADDNITIPGPGHSHNIALEARNQLSVGPALTINNNNGYTGLDGAVLGLWLRKRAGHTATTTITGPLIPYSASAAIQARVDISDIFPVGTPLIANGWYCGIKPVITTSVGNTVENFIWLHAGTGQYSGSLLNGYGVYINQLNNSIGNKWGIYQEGANDKNYFNGRVGIGTNTPAVKLHVSGEQKIEGTRADSILVVSSTNPNSYGIVKLNSKWEQLYLSTNATDGFIGTSFHDANNLQVAVISHYPLGKEWFFQNGNQVPGTIMTIRKNSNAVYSKMFMDNGHLLYGSHVQATADNGAQIQVYGTGYFSDTLTATTLNAADSSNRMASTAFVKRQGFAKAQPSLQESFIKRTTVSDAGYAATTTDYLIAYTALTAGRTVTLPAASSMTNRIIIIKDESGAAGTHSITVNVIAGGNIDGASSRVLSTAYGSLELYSTGTQWFTK